MHGLGADQESERLVGILREHPAARPLMGLSGGTDPAVRLKLCRLHQLRRDHQGAVTRADMHGQAIRHFVEEEVNRGYAAIDAQRNREES
jgi:hypothetical protein